MVKHIINNISYDKFLTLIVASLIAIIIIGIIIIIVVKVIEQGRTKRTEILSKRTPPEKNKEIVGKQLEKEIKNEGKFAMFIERIVNTIKGK